MESKKNKLFDKLSRNVKRKVLSFNFVSNNIPIKFANKKTSFNSVKISRLDLNKYNTLDRTSMLHTENEKSNSSVKYSNKYLNMSKEKNKMRDRYKSPINLKSDFRLTLLSSRYLNIYKINKNPEKNKRLLSAIHNNKKLEEKIIKFKINKKKEKLLSFSNRNYSKTMNKISKPNKKNTKNHKEINCFSKREINLLDNPNSLFYQLFYGSKEIEKTIGKYKTIKREQKIKEYKKYIKKDEEEAGKQLYLLKKDIHIGDQEKISGKIISSNTFFDLKISLT
jgi:hypothetical protein